MSELNKKSGDISEKIDKGATPPTKTLRTILGWLGVSGRGNNVNWRVRRALEHAGLETEPEFRWACVHLPHRFVRIGSNVDRNASSTIFRIDGLESANRKPVAVRPDSQLTEAITIMLTNDFSQLAVMTSDREVKGTVRWKSIGVFP